MAKTQVTKSKRAAERRAAERRASVKKGSAHVGRVGHARPKLASEAAHAAALARAARQRLRKTKRRGNERAIYRVVSNGAHGWYVNKQIDGVIYRQYFADEEFGGTAESSKAAAREYRGALEIAKDMGIDPLTVVVPKRGRRVFATVTSNETRDGGESNGDESDELRAEL